MLRSVKAVADLLGREEIDLHRVVRLGQTVHDESSIRLMMGLYVSPLNRRQAAGLIRGGVGAAGNRLGWLRYIGLVEHDDREPGVREHRLTPKGRKLLLDLIEAASEFDDLPPLRVAAAIPAVDLFEPKAIRLTGDRRARAEAAKPLGDAADADSDAA